MENLQEMILKESKKLIKTFNPIRFLIYFAITGGLMLIILLIMQMLEWYTAIIVVVLATGYSFLRDYFVYRLSSKLIDQFYEYTMAKKPEVDLFVPMLDKGFQGFLLRKTALCFVGDEMHLEAFNQPRGRKEEQQSMRVDYGKDFSVVINFQDKNELAMIYQGLLYGKTYRFSVVNKRDLVKKIEKRIKGGK